jgi:osmotically-inducible protein OsmY
LGCGELRGCAFGNQRRCLKANAVEMDVKLEPVHKRSDSDMAAAAESALVWHSQVPADRIQVMVEKGWVTLKGEMDWDFQRCNASKAVRSLSGVVGVTNAIALKPSAAPANVAGRILEALKRHAEHEAKVRP